MGIALHICKTNKTIKQINVFQETLINIYQAETKQRLKPVT